MESLALQVAEDLPLVAQQLSTQWQEKSLQPPPGGGVPRLDLDAAFNGSAT